MIRHALGSAAATALIVLIALLPFLPGPYDPLAAPLSMMARVFAFVGLLLVESRWRGPARVRGGGTHRLANRLGRRLVCGVPRWRTLSRRCDALVGEVCIP